MADYPDYTQLFNLVGSDIMVPIDIQGAYIMLPVDIQAQWATLEISIVAQTVEFLTVDIAAQTIDKLDINLAATDITLGINITSITGGVTFNIGTVTGTVKVNMTASAIVLDINIKNITAGVTFNIGNIEGPFNIFIGTIQTVGIYLQPEWAAKTGIDKNFYAGINEVGFDYEEWGTYTVTAYKTLYIQGMSFAVYAFNSADADKPQHGVAYLIRYIADEILATIGGDGGGSITFPKPIAIPSNVRVEYGIFCETAHDSNLRMTVWGYEE